MSGRPIKMNELITVRFTPLDSSLDRVALLTRQVSVRQHRHTEWSEIPAESQVPRFDICEPVCLHSQKNTAVVLTC